MNGRWFTWTALGLALCLSRTGNADKYADEAELRKAEAGAWDVCDAHRNPLTSASLTACEQKWEEIESKYGSRFTEAHKQNMQAAIGNLAAALKNNAEADLSNKTFKEFKQSLRDDRLKVFKQWGTVRFPSDGVVAHDTGGYKFARQIRVAPVWYFTQEDVATIDNSRGTTVATVDRGGCTYAYNFRGDKLVSVQKQGTRCPR